jgi:ligand-binding SRPBCC domain-containing protein
MPYILERHQVVSRSLADTFAFYAEPRNLALITPPWLKFRLVQARDLEMRRGLRLEFRIHPFGFPQRWLSEITVWEPPYRFVDDQVRGPYALWRHLHHFRSTEGGGTEIYDRVAYELPFAVVGRLTHALLVRRHLQAIFDYRERSVRRLLDVAGGDRADGMGDRRGANGMLSAPENGPPT